MPSHPLSPFPRCLIPLDQAHLPWTIIPGLALLDWASPRLPLTRGSASLLWSLGSFVLEGQATHLSSQAVPRALSTQLGLTGGSSAQLVPFRAGPSQAPLISQIQEPIGGSCQSCPSKEPSQVEASPFQACSLGLTPTPLGHLQDSCKREPHRWAGLCQGTFRPLDGELTQGALGLEAGRGECKIHCPPLQDWCSPQALESFFGGSQVGCGLHHPQGLACVKAASPVAAFATLG